MIFYQKKRWALKGYAILPGLTRERRRIDFHDTRRNHNFSQRAIRKACTADVLQLRSAGESDAGQAMARRKGTRLNRSERRGEGCTLHFPAFMESIGPDFQYCLLKTQISQAMVFGKRAISNCSNTSWNSDAHWFSQARNDLLTVNHQISAHCPISANDRNDGRQGKGRIRHFRDGIRKSESCQIPTIKETALGNVPQA
jgi:hypothetical protein